MRKLIALLSAVGTLSAQQIDVTEGLPIGENFGRDIYEVWLQVWASNGINGAEDSFIFDSNGEPLEEAIEIRWRQLAAQLDATGAEHDSYQFSTGASAFLGEFRAFAFLDFSLQERSGKWVVPESVLDITLDYGGTLEFRLDGISNIDMEVWKTDGTNEYFSSRDGVGSPCQIGSISAGFSYGAALLESKYIVPAKTEGWLSGGRLKLYGTNDTVAEFDLSDGTVLSYSTPPPAFLKFPEPTPPRITSLTRVGNTTTITVAGGSNSAITVEWKEKLGDDWQAISYATPLSLNGSGTGTFTHVSATSSGFYRISAHSGAVERKAVNSAASSP